jgi:hypothetical protein
MSAEAKSPISDGTQGSSNLGLGAKWVTEECFAIRGMVQELSDRVKGPLNIENDRSTFLPMIFLLGNHSSGKSSFINFVMGRDIQQCGVAPTDDKFTVICSGSSNITKDGHSLIGISLCF